MLYVFHGPDQFRAREELQAVRRQLDHEGNLIHNTVRLEGRGLTPGELRAACHAASFFAENRLVIVEGLQGRFSGVRRTGRAPNRAGVSDLEAFAEVLTTLPDTTTAVLLDEQAARGFLSALGENATVREFPILRLDALRQWASSRAGSQNATLSPAALDRLVALIDGYHLGELAHEIDKLATYANGRTIELADVDLLTSAAVQYQIWDLTDAVIAGRTGRALAFVETMAARGGRDYAPQLLIFMLTRQYRQLLLAKALLEDGLSQQQIGERLRIGPFPLRRVLDQTNRYPTQRLETAYRRLLETDVAVKTGALEVDTALELLIVDLSELAKAPRRPSTARR